MKRRNLIILVFLMIALISVYYVIRHNNLKNQEEQNTDASEKVLSLELSDVVFIQFNLDGQQVDFVKDGDTWKLSGDDSFRVNASAVESAISAVTDMTSERTLEEIANLEEYGLDKPVQTVVLKSQEGTVCNIYFGNSNESTGNDYVCSDDDKTKVYTVSSSVAQTFTGTLEDYRDTEEETESTETDTTESGSTEDAGTTQ
ncbi:MAG: DUF4340 domain-containing protein [Lachnospiraceae bacterium]|nr:DUF4340 domain-containing protein [Lachnospiraceae bacterium]